MITKYESVKCSDMNLIKNLQDVFDYCGIDATVQNYYEICEMTFSHLFKIEFNGVMYPIQVTREQMTDITLIIKDEVKRAFAGKLNCRFFVSFEKLSEGKLMFYTQFYGKNFKASEFVQIKINEILESFVGSGNDWFNRSYIERRINNFLNVINKCHI